MRDGLGGLRTRSRRTRVVHRDFEPLAFYDSAGTFGGHHCPHLAAKLGGYLPVDERLLDRRRKLALPAKLCGIPVAAYLVDVG